MTGREKKSINNQEGFRPLSVTMMFAASSLAFATSSLSYPCLMKGRDRVTGFVLCLSLLTSCMAFLLNGPMFPLSSHLEPSFGIMITSSLLLGSSIGVQQMSAFAIGMREMQDMGVDQDAAFTTAFAAIVLSSASSG